MASGRLVVGVVRATEPARDLPRCLEALGGAARFAKRGDRVLIKPNFGVPRLPDTGAVTDPDLVLALADAFLAVGAKVLIGESCVTGFNLQTIYDMLAMTDRARARGIALVDLRTDRPAEVIIPDPLVLPKVRIARTALDVDLIVNVPKMKTHVETTVTLALKNVKGLLPGNEKARLHQLDDTPGRSALEAAIADLNTVLPPTLNVVDGIVAMEGGGPIEGTPVPMQVLVAGDNRCAVDVAACHLMHVDPRGVLHLQLSAERGLGPGDLQGVQLVGDDAEALRRPFSRADEADFDVPSVDLVEAGACSACAGGIRQALRGLRNHPRAVEAARRLRVYVGVKVEGPDSPDDLVVGACAMRKLKRGRVVPGCPPLFGKMRVAVLRALAGEDDETAAIQDGDRRL